jgi:hypothetical protein
MKTTKAIVTFSLLFIASFMSFGQGISPQKRQAMLDSIAYSDAPAGAVLFAIEYDIAEALPLIEKAFWRTKKIPSKAACLEAMLVFQSPYVGSYARAAYDSAQYYAYHEFDDLNLSSHIQMHDSLQVQVMATRYLLQSGDYSTVQCVFDLLRRDKSQERHVNVDALLSLKEIALRVPQYADSAKSELRRIMEEASFHLDRWRALLDFVNVYGKDAFPEILYAALNDIEPTNRISAIDDLYELDYPDMHNFLRQRLATEPEASYRRMIADSLLQRYGTPEDYQLVRQYMSQEPNETIRALMGYAIRDFRPPMPSAMISVVVILDTLVSTKHQTTALGWLAGANFATELEGNLQSASSYLSSGDSLNCARQVKAFQQKIDEEYKDSLDSDNRTVTIEGWKFLYYNAQYILDRLPQVPPVPGVAVKLVNSTGARLTDGSLQYYEGGWKDAVNNNDGTFTVITSLHTVSLRMTYAYASQTKSNVTVGPDTVVFQTVNAQVQLRNSQGAQMDTGTVQYYAGAWRSFGTTTSGTASNELLPGNYSFRMTYGFASKDKQQDIGTNPTVVFQTVNAVVQLQNSQGSLIDQGTVQYYSGAWRDFGVTSNGIATKELLPNNYSFRMTYAFASNDKQQDIGTSPTVVFQTVNAAVQLQNSQGNLIDQGAVQYYAGAWRAFGSTSNGTVSKELLPANYSFRMTHEFISLDKAQDISTNNTVSYSTVSCTVRVRNSQNQPVDNAQASYYSGAWRQIGATVNGEVTKELLPVNLTFRINYEGTQQDKVQNLATNSVVEFVVQ